MATSDKKPYVILQEEELAMKIKSPAFVLYAGMKSFLGNGKLSMPLQPEQVTKRINKYRKFFYDHIVEVLEKTPMEICGHKKIVGGTVEIYRIKCTQSDTLNGDQSVTKQEHSQKIKCNETVTKVYQNSDESVTTLSTKTIQSNKVKSNRENYQPLSYEQLYKIASDLQVPFSAVDRKHQTILDKIAAGEFNYKTIYFTLRQWLRNDLDKGYILPLDEIGQLELDAQSPENQKVFEEAEKLIGGGK